MERAIVHDHGDKSKDGGLCIGGAMLLCSGPGLQIAGDNFDQLAQVLAQHRIGILTEFEGAELHQAQQLGLLSQGGGNQLEGALQSCPPVRGLCDPAQQIAAQLHLLQLRVEYGQIQIPLARKMPVDRYLVDARRGGYVARADAVVAEVGKEPRRAEENTLPGAATSGIRYCRHGFPSAAGSLPGSALAAHQAHCNCCQSWEA